MKAKPHTILRQVQDRNGDDVHHQLMGVYWVLVWGFIFRYHNKETLLSTVDPHYRSLNIKSLV